jgi:recombinational DNA repair protein RecR
MKSKRENEVRKKSLRYDAKEIKLAVKLIKELQDTVDVIYYLMEHEDVESFVLMMISAKNVSLENILKSEKRDTDILFEIDKKKSIYVMLCQDTKVDGGYMFAERVIRTAAQEHGTDIYCTELEVRSTQHKIKNVIFKLLESFIKAKQEKKTNEIVYRSLN